MVTPQSSDTPDQELFNTGIQRPVLCSCFIVTAIAPKFATLRQPNRSKLQPLSENWNTSVTSLTRASGQGWQQCSSPVHSELAWFQDIIGNSHDSTLVTAKPQQWSKKHKSFQAATKLSTTTENHGNATKLWHPWSRIIQHWYSASSALFLLYRYCICT